MTNFRRLKNEISARGPLANLGTGIKFIIAVLGVYFVWHQNETSKILMRGQENQTERLQRQNTEIEAARASYADIADIILDPAAPVHAQIAALRLIPNAWRSSVSGPKSQGGKKSYPAARTLKIILSEYVRRPRGGERPSDIELLDLEDLSTKILVLLHKLGPVAGSERGLWDFPPEDQGFTEVPAPHPRGEQKGLPRRIDLKHIPVTLFARINLPYALNSQEIVIEFPDGANFGRANLVGANFRNCILKGAKFPQADLSGTDFRGAQLIGADFSNCKLEGAKFDPDVQLPVH